MLEKWAAEFNALPPLNHKRFRLSEDFIPIVMLVHQRTLYLRHVIEQYRRVIGINQTMLIISHDGIFPGMCSSSHSNFASFPLCPDRETILPEHICTAS